MSNGLKQKVGLDLEVAEFLRNQCRKISIMANNVPTGTFEFDALIDASAGIQDVLERHGEWEPEPQTTNFKI